MKKTYKYLLPGIFFCLVSSGVLAQEQQPVLASIVYDFVHVNDTNNRDKPVKEQMILRLSQKNSIYLSLTKEERLEELKKSLMESMGPETRGRLVGLSNFSVRGPGLSTEELFQFPQDEKLVAYNKLGAQDYIIESPLPKIAWSIDEETREIGGFACQRATGQYAGRTYTAWFSPDLPFQAGPWKLSGLPGLILEAEDSKQEVAFRFQEFREKEEDRYVSFPQNALKTDEKAFARAKVAFEENPMAGRQAPPPGATVVRSFRDASGREITEGEAKANRAKAQKEAKDKNNNPIELK